jgi:hypothetical protein
VIKKCKLDREKKQLLSKEKNKKNESSVLESKNLKHMYGGTSGFDAVPDSKKKGLA